MFSTWGSFVYRFRWVVATASLLCFAGFAMVAMAGGHLYEQDSITTEASRAEALARQVRPAQPDRATFLLVFTSPSMTVSNPDFQSAMEAALAPLRSDPRVYSIATPYEVGGESMISNDRHSATALVTLTEDSERAQSDYPALRRLIHSDDLWIVATGELAVNSDFQRLTDEGLSRAEKFALPLSLLILVVAFGGVLAGLLPLGVGVMAITAATAVTYLIARRWGVDPGATELVVLLGLGLAIDYSLFVVNRFREELQRFPDVRSALAATTAAASRSITFSGLTVMAGLSGLFFFRGTWLGTVVVPMISVVALALFFNLTFLTALLALLGRRIDWLRLPLLGPGEPGAVWRRIASGVMRRPSLLLIVALGVVVVAALPILQINLATDHLAMLPTSAESRRGADLVATRFPDQQFSGQLVVVDFSDIEASSDEAAVRLDAMTRRLRGLRNVTAVTSAATGGHVAAMAVKSNVAERSEAARQLVRELRQEHVSGAQLLVGGGTAGDMDRTDAILARAPVAAGAVALATYLLLFLLLGSVVLPLKAVLSNLLSLGASFGAIVWIFQEGHLSGLLGFSPGATDPTLPVLMFCLLFGLSMDYEVFLLTRIQEEYRRTANNRAAVAFGLQRSGRLVTFAAAIMVTVFAAFGVSQLVVFKAASIGASLAVLVDATIVRSVIVPALMALMGRLNWWAPSWLHPGSRTLL